MKKAVSLMLFMMCSVAFSAPSQMRQDELTKRYISEQNICFLNGRMMVQEGFDLLNIKTLHQDEEGLYYFHAAFSLYGYCPNGHPYSADGGCLGNDCPYN